MPPPSLCILSVRPAWRSLTRKALHQRLEVPHFRSYTDRTPQRSAHARWYADTVPAMIPVALLGSAVYLSLQLAQVHLSHEKDLDKAVAKIQELESELDVLRVERDRRIQQSAGIDKKSRWWFTQT